MSSQNYFKTVNYLAELKVPQHIKDTIRKAKDKASKVAKIATIASIPIPVPGSTEVTAAAGSVLPRTAAKIAGLRAVKKATGSKLSDLPAKDIAKRVTKDLKNVAKSSYRDAKKDVVGKFKKVSGKLAGVFGKKKTA